MKHQKCRVGVIGAGRASAAGLQLATQVGRLLAERGAVLVCGGLGGVMEAASKGCAEAGGEVVGILPGAEAGSANPYVTLPVVTDMGHARNVIIAHTAQALIAIEGEYGTLSEMAIGLKLGRKVFLLNCQYRPDGAVVVETPEDAVRLALNAIEGGDR